MSSLWLTFGLGGLVVGLADQLPVLHEVELVAGVELPGAHDAGEALQVVDVVLRPPHHLRGGNPKLAAGALRAETSAPTAHREHTNVIVTSSLTNLLDGESTGKGTVMLEISGLKGGS